MARDNATDEWKFVNFRVSQLILSFFNEQTKRRPTSRCRASSDKNIGNEEFADKVPKRIRELKLTWPDGRPIQNEVDYALYLLGSKDERVRKEVFIDLVVRKHGPAGKMALKSTEAPTFEVILSTLAYDGNLKLWWAECLGLRSQ